jgi:hypothetical protein
VGFQGIEPGDVGAPEVLDAVLVAIVRAEVRLRGCDRLERRRRVAVAPSIQPAGKEEVDGQPERDDGYGQGEEEDVTHGERGSKRRAVLLM